MNKKEGYVPKDKRKRILLLCDDLRSQSGVAHVARELVLNTCHTFNWVNLGGSIQHPEKGKRLDLSEDSNKFANIDDSSVVIYPTDGYGNPDLLRSLLQIEKPDAIFLITDPRYFEWVFMMENEIRKQCPIVYLNIWDSPFPYPTYNKVFYESCDMLLAISKQTKNINETVLGTKASSKIIKYLPHGLNENVFKPLDRNSPELLKLKETTIGTDKTFVLMFNSRNIRRKQIPDTMLAWRLFLDKLPKDEANKCVLILHTEIVSEHGTDLEEVRKTLLNDYPTSIYYSINKLHADELNKLYNLSDAQILLTSNEGWGLSLTEAILAGNVIIANVQGGMIDQMGFEDTNGNWLEYNKDFPSNHRGTYKNHGEWAYPVYPTNISIQGSPKTPFISDDRCSPEDAAAQIYAVYNTPKDIRQERGLKGRNWAINTANFTSTKMATNATTYLNQLFSTWKPREKYTLTNVTKHKEETVNNVLNY
jgi:glycosyltransferase involved in cell wall biosynthesis